MENFNKINDELSGKNEYNRIENINSRRFIYTSNTCISLIQCLIRDNFFDIKVFLRSSNAKDSLYYDINFIKFLSKKIYDHLKLKNHLCRYNVTINSCHIPGILSYNDKEA